MVIWCYNDVFIVSVTSVPGIAESSDATGDADVQSSTTLTFRGKTDMIIHKGKSLGKVMWYMCLCSDS